MAITCFSDKMPTISPAFKQRILIECMRSIDPATGKLRAGTIKKIQTEIIQVSRGSIIKIHREYQEQLAIGVFPELPHDRRKKNSGRKSKLLDAELRQAYIDICQEYADMWLHLTYELLRIELYRGGYELSTSTIHKHMKSMNKRTVNVKLKPTLSEAQRHARMEFVLDRADLTHGYVQANHYFQDQYDVIHVDESWFFLQTNDNYITIIDGVTVPEAQKTQHKSHIPKIMFMVAMARPRVVQTPEGEVHFDGKLGMWPIADLVPAQRNSRNRPRGTLEYKGISLTADIYREFFTMEGGIFDSIKEKMPWLRGTHVFIQHDGAKPHTGLNNEALIAEAGSTDGWSFVMDRQPAQSPDLNILDLGLFHSLKQKVSHMKIRATNLNQLVEKVKRAYEEYDTQTLDGIWGQLYACWRCILRTEGSNTYAIPHEGGRRRYQEGGTSVDRTIIIEEYNHCWELVYGNGQQEL